MRLIDADELIRAVANHHYLVVKQDFSSMGCAFSNVVKEDLSHLILRGNIYETD